MPQLSIDQAFQIALGHHQAGRLQEAEQLYRQILAQDPRHADALHLLGVVAHQVGRNDLAVQLIRQAITLKPRYAEAHNNLGVALKELGQFDDAVSTYRQAILLKPSYADAYGNLGVALRHQGKLDDALIALRQAIALKPSYPEAYSNLGVALRDLGKLGEAIAACRQALQLNPNYADAYSNLGIALRDQGQFQQAIAAFRQAIAIKPNYSDAYSNLGVALRDVGQLQEAVAAYRQAIALNPRDAAAYSNLGVALGDLGQRGEAIAACRQAIALKPDFPDGLSNLGKSLKDDGQLDEAIIACRQAIAVNPRFFEAYNNLGNIFKDQGQVGQAITLYRQVLVLKPDYSEVRSNLVMAMGYEPGYDAPAIAVELRLWQQRHAEPLKKLIRPCTNDRIANRRLRIGYVSPDFREHPVGRFLLPLLAHHDKTQVELFAYAQVPMPDDLTERLRSYIDVWHTTVGHSDNELADLVRLDQIDILVDLALHTAGNRLLVFAQKPAPVQVTFAGYPGTTGLTTIDHRLTDPYLDPPGSSGPPTSSFPPPATSWPPPAFSSDEWYFEKSYRLPHSFWCFDPQTEEPEVAPLPVSQSGWITFGCLNNFCKVNDGVLELWARVLRAVPRSRLLLLAKEGSHRQRTVDFLGKEGVGRERVEFAAPRSRGDYLALYHRVDIGLDTLPYNGHTTSLDSYWMGVPVVTLVGATVVGRAGLSQLSNLGLQELAAGTAEEFVGIAVRLAGDVVRLEGLRGTLRERMKRSPLMDGGGFARDGGCVPRDVAEVV